MAVAVRERPIRTSRATRMASRQGASRIRVAPARLAVAVQPRSPTQPTRAGFSRPRRLARGPWLILRNTSPPTVQTGCGDRLDPPDLPQALACVRARAAALSLIGSGAVRRTL